MSSIQVHFEPTPNPATYRFCVSEPIASEMAEFTDASNTFRSPLATKIFGFPWTAGVLIGPDFVAISKQEWVDWETLAEPLAGLIREHLERGLGVLNEEAAEAESVAAEMSPEERQIRQILEQEIRPAVAMDGGDIVFQRYQDGVVYLQMRGACSGCPSSTMTLKMGIESRLKEAVPAITEVVAVD